MSLNGVKQLARQLMTHRHHRPHALLTPSPFALPSSVSTINARLLFTRSITPILRHAYQYHPPPLRSPLTTASTMTTTTSADHPLNLDAIFKQKKALRSKVRRDLKSMDPTLRSKEDDAIQNLALEAPWFKSCQKLCAYISCSALREVDTSKLLAQILNYSSKDDYLQMGKTLYVPRVEDKNSHMRMLKISSMDDLIANSMNILEPAPMDSEGKEREDVMLADHPVDLLLLPGLAFDKSGRRLGRGGGYYDAFLTRYQGLVKERKWKQPFLVALSYSVQIMDEGVVPVTPNDVFVDALVSPSGVIPISAAAKARCQ
ncbi:5-formyltetrahydrofolate cyclo-ligase, mitochondrial isoform X1 [Coffea eugenioides]|uniref:5-formyltetrahydrofolate cyclo-ligase n=1 Tax=Coffea arabica TaxID=13443 RepID=A0A6P6XH57_COFAR|nr:5-formyltetrahydrofolate cyclo-ligase, mitochondrial isoform X1 [Coffea eugenioides]